jgi:hypothetical protein
MRQDNRQDRRLRGAQVRATEEAVYDSRRASAVDPNGLYGWVMEPRGAADAAATRRGLITVMCTLGASRILARAAGVTFDASPLDWYWQYLDVELLREQPLTSIAILHSQPPLFNLFLAAVLNLFPNHVVGALNVSFMALGAVLAGSVFLVLVELGLTVRAAVIVAAVFCASPPCILYENYLFYEYPVAALSGLLALFTVRVARRPSTSTTGAVLAVAAALVLLRSVFHLAWYAALATWVVFAVPAAKRATALALAALVFLAPAGWYAKNQLLFGFAGASSWLGMSMARMTVASLPTEDAERLRREGRLSDLSRVEPFSPPHAYAERIAAWVPSGIPALDRPTKANGEPNYNHGAFIQISGTYGKDALVAVAERPMVYLRNVLASALIFSAPPTQLWALEKNRRRLAGLERVFGVLGSWQWSAPPREHIMRLGSTPPRAWSMADLFRYAGAWCLLGLPLLVVLALLRSWQTRTNDRVTSGVLLCMALHVAYVVAVGTLFEISENNRYQFLVLPHTLALLAALKVSVSAVYTSR